MSKASIPEAEREERSGDGRRKREVYVPFWIFDETPYEAISLRGKRDPVFLYLDDETRQFKIREFLEEEDGTRILPYQRHKHKYKFEMVPEVLNIPPFKDIYERLFWFIESYFSHYDRRIQILIALYLAHSYILKKSLGTIFLWLVGPTNTGKTTLQKLTELLGYRSFSGTTTSEASVYRILGSDVEYAPLILLREFNTSTPYMREITREADIPGATVPRVDELDGRREVVEFYVYGARIVASNELHGNEADRARFFFITTSKGWPKRPRSDFEQDHEIKERIQRLRNDLLLWKLANWKNINIPRRDPKGEILEDRDWEHFAGIIYLASLVGPEIESEIRSLIREYISEREEEEKEFSLPKIMARIIYELCDEKHIIDEGFGIMNEEWWDKLCEEFRQLDENRVIGPGGKTITREKAAKLIKEQLFGKRTRWWVEENGKRRKVRGFVWTKDALRRLKITFGLQSLGTLGPLGTPPKEVKGEGGTVSEPSSHDSGQTLQSNISYPLGLSPSVPTGPKHQTLIKTMGPLGPVGDSSGSEKIKEDKNGLPFHGAPSYVPPSPDAPLGTGPSGPTGPRRQDEQLPPQDIGALKPESSILTQTHEEKLPPYMESLIERGLISKNEDGSWSCRVCEKMRLKEFQAIWLHVVLCENSHKNEVVMRR